MAEKEYIDREKLMHHIKDLPTWWEDGGGVYGPPMKYPEGLFAPDDVIVSIENSPAADVTQVVRCKDCDLWNEWDKHGIVCSCAQWSGEGGHVVYTEPDDFCSYGNKI